MFLYYKLNTKMTLNTSCSIGLRLNTKPTVYICRFWCLPKKVTISFPQSAPSATTAVQLNQSLQLLSPHQLHIWWAANLIHFNFLLGGKSPTELFYWWWFSKLFHSFFSINKTFFIFLIELYKCDQFSLLK